jgi:hypothetical protein
VNPGEWRESWLHFWNISLCFCHVLIRIFLTFTKNYRIRFFKKWIESHIKLTKQLKNEQTNQPTNQPTKQLTQWTWVTFQKPRTVQPIKKCKHFMETEISLPTRARHYALPWARWIQPAPHLILLR